MAEIHSGQLSLRYDEHLLDISILRVWLVLLAWVIGSSVALCDLLRKLDHLLRIPQLIVGSRKSYNGKSHSLLIHHEHLPNLTLLLRDHVLREWRRRLGFERVKFGDGSLA